MQPTQAVYRVQGRAYTLPLTLAQCNALKAVYVQALRGHGHRTLGTLRRMAAVDPNLKAALAGTMCVPDESFAPSRAPRSNKGGPLTLLRLELGLTTAELADKLGRHEATIRVWERREKWPSSLDIPDWAQKVLEPID
jgi:DNA-binding transcriptional regulator YiaG